MNTADGVPAALSCHLALSELTDQQQSGERSGGPCVTAKKAAAGCPWQSGSARGSCCSRADQLLGVCQGMQEGAVRSTRSVELPVAEVSFPAWGARQGLAIIEDA